MQVPAGPAGMGQPLGDLGGVVSQRLSKTTWMSRRRGTDRSIILKNASTSTAVWVLRHSVITSPVAMFNAANRSVVPFRL